jgi:hypothetical protein
MIPAAQLLLTDKENYEIEQADRTISIVHTFIHTYIHGIGEGDAGEVRNRTWSEEDR